MLACRNRLRAKPGASPMPLRARQASAAAATIASRPDLKTAMVAFGDKMSQRGFWRAM
jgi:hypothetical protein